MRRIPFLSVSLPAAAAASRAHAATLAAAPDCGLTSQCGLGRILYLLYAAAVVLVIVLAAALGMAIYFYRRNKRSEITRR